MNKIKVGVIGLGFIGPAHVEALRRLGTVEITAIAGNKSEEQKAASLGIPNFYTDYKDLIKNNDINCVHICSPNSLHYIMAKDALEADKHVVCEKPLTVNIQEAEELIELSEKKQRVNAIHFNVRFYPLMRQIQTMVKKGEFGDIFAIHGSYLQDWLFLPTDYNWRLEQAQSGKSRAVGDIGSHWLDLIEYISGLKIVEVLADFATFHKTRKKPLKPVETYAGKILKPEDYLDVKINTEDYASILLRFNNGGRGVLTVSQVAAGRKNRIFFEIDGSKKSVAWESEVPNQMWIGKRESPNEIFMKDPSLVYSEVSSLIDYPGGHNEGFPDTLKQVFKEVYSYIRAGRFNEKPTFPTFKDGLREMIVGEKIVESNIKGQWTKID